MQHFEVWAPRPERVQLHVDGRTLPMQPTRRGWWKVTVDGAGPGSRYGYRLDGGDPLPDPRSPSQPDGVDGLSEVVDHGGFVWTDDAWRGVSPRGPVLYELHVGTFTPAGTFDAAAEKLDHLVALGVDAIELMPVVEFPGERGWGYDGVDLFAPHHAYGGPEGLKRLVDACHASGLGVVIDVVYNHLGPSGNHLAAYGPYFSERHQTGWGAAVNFDGPGSDEVRRFVVDNAAMWLRDYHADGLRLDAVHAIIDDSARHILEQLSSEVDALAAHLRRPLFLVAESDRNDPRYVRSRDAGGYGVDAAWADEWHHALHAVLTGERGGYYEDFGSLDQLAKALRQAWVYDGTWSPHRRRHHGQPPLGLVGHQFVVCIQNHDQVGNRAAGERLGALTSEGRLRVAAALLLCGPFTPLLFQGEEWGASTPFRYFTAHRDPALGRAVTEGRRNEFARFGWDPADVPDPQAPNTFAASKLDWAEVDRPPHAGLLAWYERLVQLRRRLPELSDPRLASISVEVDEEAGTLDVRRGAVRLLVNLGDQRHCFTLAAEPAMLAASDEEETTIEGTTVSLGPDAVVIVLTREVADLSRDEGAHHG
jgi:maltooligosyltrehalose trehalohydrolase